MSQAFKLVSSARFSIDPTNMSAWNWTGCCLTLTVLIAWRRLILFIRWRGEPAPAECGDHQCWMARWLHARSVLPGPVCLRILLSLQSGCHRLQWTETASRRHQRTKTKGSRTNWATELAKRATANWKVMWEEERRKERKHSCLFSLCAGIKQAKERAAASGEEEAPGGEASAEVSPE